MSYIVHRVCFCGLSEEILHVAAIKGGDENNDGRDTDYTFCWQTKMKLLKLKLKNIGRVVVTIGSKGGWSMYETSAWGEI